MVQGVEFPVKVQYKSKPKKTKSALKNSLRSSIYLHEGTEKKTPKKSNQQKVGVILENVQDAGVLPRRQILCRTQNRLRWSCLNFIPLSMQGFSLPPYVLSGNRFD